MAILSIEQSYCEQAPAAWAAEGTSAAKRPRRSTFRQLLAPWLWLWLCKPHKNCPRRGHFSLRRHLPLRLLAVSAPVTATAIAAAPVAATAPSALAPTCVAAGIAAPASSASASPTAAPLPLSWSLALPGEGVGADVAERGLHGIGLCATRALITSVAPVVTAFWPLPSTVTAKLAREAGSRACSATPTAASPALVTPAAVSALWPIVAVQWRL